MNLNLEGRSALVCASTRGLGFAVAQALVQEGAQVFICGRDARALEEALAKLRQQTRKTSLKGTQGALKEVHQSVQGIVLDLTQPGATETLASRAEQAFGKVDILVNNVGGPLPSSALGTTDRQWQLGFDQLFMTTARLTQRLVEPMRQRGFGRVITITSISVVEPIEHLVVSTAMRQAVTGFCKTLAFEVARDGVTVNTVLPGVIHTQRIEDLRKARAERLGSTLGQEMSLTAESIPMGRLGRPEELGAVVAFLASPLASYVTGCNIPIDGGLRRGM